MCILLIKYLLITILYIYVDFNNILFILLTISQTVVVVSHMKSRRQENHH